MNDERSMMWIYAGVWVILIVLANPFWRCAPDMFMWVWTPMMLITTFALSALILRTGWGGAYGE